MEAILFLGCNVPIRNLNYEISTRAISKILGLKLLDFSNTSCCGYPLKNSNKKKSLFMAAQILAKVKNQNLPLITLCSACAGTLNEARYILTTNTKIKKEINEKLAPLKLKYNPKVKVKHFIHFLLEDIGLRKIKNKIIYKLKDFYFAPHYGCHYLKPTTILRSQDNPENPQTLKNLISITGAKSIKYNSLNDCCGGGLIGINKDLALTMAKNKLTELSNKKVTALTLICPFCNVMYEGQQKSIMKKSKINSRVPILYITQLLGLALGLTPKELGFKLNRSKPKDLLNKFKNKHID